MRFSIFFLFSSSARCQPSRILMEGRNAFYLGASYADYSLIRRMHYLFGGKSESAFSGSNHRPLVLEFVEKYISENLKKVIHF